MSSERKQFISPNNPEIEYFDLLDMIVANQCGAQLARNAKEFDLPITQKFMWIRHDIDYDLEKAINLARAESEYGYRSTYYLLHTAPYWNANGFEGIIKELAKLRHDIGLHNNALAAWYSNPEGPRALEIFKDAKKRLEDIAGMPVYSTSAHGDPLCRQIGFINYDIFEEAKKFHDPPDLPNLVEGSLKDLMMFEAYFTRRDAYLSDSGHKWRGAVKEEIPPFERFDKFEGAKRTVEKFNAMRAGILQLLVHPCWWEEKA